MNETTLDSMATPQSNVAKAKRKLRRTRAGTYGYWILAATVCVGWLLRREGLVDPEEGLGYQLLFGIQLPDRYGKWHLQLAH